MRHVSILFTLTATTMTASGDPQFFTSRPLFDQAVDNAGWAFSDSTDFEQARIARAGFATLVDPLNEFTNNAFFRPGEIGTGISIQANVDGIAETGPAPRGNEALALFGEDVLGFGLTKFVATNFWGDSTDILVEQNIRAVSFELATLVSPSPLRIRIYDRTNVLIATETLPANFRSLGFYGIVSDEAIGRINLAAFDTGIQNPENLDNISTWIVPAPAGSLALALGASVLGIGRRRRAAGP